MAKITKKSVLGTLGEDLAIQYLESLGWIFLSRNLRFEKVGEIDLVMEEPDGSVSLVEVKSGVPNSLGLLPEDNLTFRKLRKMRSAAEMYILKNSKLSGVGEVRVHAISILFPSEDPFLTNSYKDCIINLYKDIDLN